MSLISRQNKKAYKNSNHNKDLILTNFLPIKNISLFDECKQYIENLKVKDITSTIAERNGTLTILYEPTESIYSLYTNDIGYVRFMKIMIDIKYLILISNITKRIRISSKKYNRLIQLMNNYI